MNEVDVLRIMRAIMASVPDGVVGVHHATIFARAALRELYPPAPTQNPGDAAPESEE